MLKRLVARIQITLLSLQRGHLFDLCRQTGGEASPYLDEYRALDEKVTAARWSYLHG